jgi:hypothetical protein
MVEEIDAERSGARFFLDNELPDEFRGSISCCHTDADRTAKFICDEASPLIMQGMSKIFLTIQVKWISA